MLKPFIIKISDGGVLTRTEASVCFEKIMSGKTSQEETALFLWVLRTRGEDIQEILGAVDVLRVKSLKVLAPKNAIDVCGTGGDGIGTYNISTTVAFLVAAAGVPVAKHGNRSVSSRSGSADVLQALGVNIDASKEVMEKSLSDIGIGFFFAPKYHGAMKNVGAIRKKMGVRTIFNLLGPLLNPANVNRQLIGVYDKKWIRPIAETLLELGAKKALVVCADDGLDEITVTGKTFCALLDHGKIEEFSINPQKYLNYKENEFPTQKRLIGGDASFNAEAMKIVLKDILPKNDELKSYQDMVILNAAAALTISLDSTKKFEIQLEDAIERIYKILAGGRAMKVFNQLMRETNV